MEYSVVFLWNKLFLFPAAKSHWSRLKILYFPGISSFHESNWCGVKQDSEKAQNRFLRLQLGQECGSLVSETKEGEVCEVLNRKEFHISDHTWKGKICADSLFVQICSGKNNPWDLIAWNQKRLCSLHAERKALFNPEQLLFWLDCSPGGMVPLLCFSFELCQDIYCFTTILLHVALGRSVPAALTASPVHNQKGSCGVFLVSVLGVWL